MSLLDVERLRGSAEVEFADIVVDALSPGSNELRIILTDGSFVVLSDPSKPSPRGLYTDPR